jgi:hypothetical protein
MPVYHAGDGRDARPPVAPDPRHVVLSRLDEYGEWLDPHGHPSLVRLLTANGGLGPYELSLSVIRGTRPSDSAYRAHLWWGDPVNRAHLLNALLRRGDRSVVEVEREADLRPGKTYAYLKSFGVAFRARPRRHVMAMDLDGDLHEAEVRGLDPQRPGTATLKLWGYPSECIGRWSVSNGCYRLLAPITEPFGVLTVDAASRVLRVHPADLARSLWRIGVPTNGSVYVAHMERLYPSGWWREDARRALAEHYEDDARRLARLIDAERLDTLGEVTHAALAVG